MKMATMNRRFHLIDNPERFVIVHFARGTDKPRLLRLVTAFIGVDFFANGEQTYSQPLWTWMSVGDFNIGSS